MKRSCESVVCACKQHRFLKKVFVLEHVHLAIVCLLLSSFFATYKRWCLYQLPHWVARGGSGQSVPHVYCCLRRLMIVGAAASRIPELEP